MSTNRWNLGVHGTPWMRLAILACCVVFGGAPWVARTAYAEGGAPPPPVVDDAPQSVVSKRMRAYFDQIVHPSYLVWLGESNGTPDTVAAFALYLSIQPMTPFERQCFLALYIERNG